MAHPHLLNRSLLLTLAVLALMVWKPALGQ